MLIRHTLSSLSVGILLLSGLCMNTSTSASYGDVEMSDYEKCMQIAHGEFEAGAFKLEERTKAKSKLCLHYPKEQGYEECISKVQGEHESGMRDLKTILGLKKRGCLKMPWAYVD